MSFTQNPFQSYESLLNRYSISDASSISVNDLTVYGNAALPYLQPFQVLSLDASSNVVGKSLQDGGIIVGATGGDVQAAQITGTTNRVSVIPGPNSITLTTPQDTDTTASPTFADMTLTNLTVSKPVKTDAAKKLISGDIDLTADVTGVLPVANGGTNSATSLVNGNLMISNAGQIVEGTSATNPTFVNETLTGLTVSMPVKTDGSKTLVSSLINLTSDISGILPIANGGTNSGTALTNGKLLVTSGGQIVEGTSVGSTFNFSNTTNSSSPTTGAVTISGGLGVALNTCVGGLIDVRCSSVAQLMLSETSGVGTSLLQLGDPLIGKGAYIYKDHNTRIFAIINRETAGAGGDMNFSPSLSAIGLTVKNTDASVELPANVTSTSTTSGTLKVTGGIGATGSVYCNVANINSATASRWVAFDSSKNLVSQVLQGTADQIVLSGTVGTGTVTLSTPQNIATTSTPLFAALGITGTISTTGLTLIGGTALRWVALDSNKNLVSQVLQGTADQIVLSGTVGTGTVTLSTPQNIATTSSPSFAAMTLGTTGTTTGLTLNNNTASYAPTVLNYYEEYNATIQFATAGGNINQTCGLRITRIGRMVNVWLIEISNFNTTGALAAVMTATAVVPTRFRPVTPTSDSIVRTSNNGTYNAGCMRVNPSSGDIQVWRDNSTTVNWQATLNYLHSASAVYSVN